ncbi:MAG TPA: adenylate/guanylate cyclase domain-containing protein [Gaiellaceae bacterium]|nr:adenylate/guanylate cyclase domain-containing protein [Gaiellaceae bacterium]
MICASCGAENREGARFCDACGAALAVDPVREQRKVVTVLFCDVAGSTALGERLDPEALRMVMSSYFDVARGAIERHGGTLEKFIGDAVMAVFGVPTVREDDALRAVRAAQELRDAVEIDIRIGVNTGPVVTGTGDTLVTGDAVNVAARLEQAAEPGEVLLGDETYRLVRDAVEAELLPPLEAKGKAAPLTAYRLGAVTGDIAVARRADAPLVGRSRERRLLTDAWERSCSERACALFTILGTAGVGKSRLSAEFLGGLEATVVHGRCLSYGEGITYWPVVEAVLQLLGDAPAPNAAIAALLGDGQAPADEIAVAVRRLFETSADERPLVVLFDDLQWAEPTFLDLVEHVADWSRDAPILLMCLARPELLELRPGWGGGKMNATTVLLEPLSAAETDELIDELLSGASLDPELRDRIRSAAEGNPLFVEQMLAMVQESPDEVTVPSTIQALLAARLDQLPSGERAALERGAVEGQVFHRGAVAALGPDEPDVSSRLLGLVRKELVRPSEGLLPGDDAFRFRHLLIRDAAYDALPKAVRAELHERFAAWLEAHAPGLVELDEILGYHLEQAARYRAELGSPARDLAIRAAGRLAAAGRRAEEREDASAAVTLLSRAASLYDADDPRRLRLLTPVAESLYGLGRLRDAYSVLDEAIGGSDADAAARAFFFKSYAQGHGESLSPFELERDARERLAQVEGVASEATLAAGRLTLAWALYWCGRLTDAIETGEEAVVRARRAGERPLEIAALRMVGMAKLHGDVPWPAVEEQAAAMASVGLEASQLLVWAAAMEGRFDEGRRISEAFVAKARERGWLLGIFTHCLTRAELELWAGNPSAAEHALREGWDELGRVGERGIRSTVGGWLGELLARRGELDQAEAILDDAIGLSTPDDYVTVSQVLIGRALVALGRGELPRAHDLAAEAVAIVDGQEYLTLQQEIRFRYAEILLQAGTREEALAAFAAAREVAERKGSTVVVARVDELLAELDD